MVATSDSGSLLRRAFGSSTRTWVSGWVVAAALVAGTGLLEAVLMQDDMWQYVATFILGYVLVVAWAVAGAVVLVASLVRERLPKAEPIANGLLLGAIGVALVLWTWFAVTAVASEGL